MQRGLALLVRREHSRTELARKLVERGIEREQAHEVVNRLVAEGWQSDERFLGMLVRTRVSQGYGPVRIRAELRTHGLEGAPVGDALEASECDWAQVARDQARRKFGEGLYLDPALARKAADFLYRRGFDGDMVRGALRRDIRD